MSSAGKARKERGQASGPGADIRVYIRLPAETPSRGGMAFESVTPCVLVNVRGFRNRPTNYTLSTPKEFQSTNSQESVPTRTIEGAGL